MLVVVAVPVLSEHRRYLVLGIVVSEGFGMRDVVIVGDTAVFGHLLVVGRGEKMGLIALTQIGAIHRIVEMRGSLAVVVATGVEIVEVETDAELLARVDTELRREVILSVGAVAAVVIREVGEGRERVGEVKLADGLHEIVVGLGEDKLPLVVSVNEDAGLSRRAEVARSVIFATQSRGEDSVGKHVRHGVEWRGRTVAKALVDGPDVDALGDLFVRSERVGVVPCVSAADVSVLVDLVEVVIAQGVLRHGQREMDSEKEKQREYLLHFRNLSPHSMILKTMEARMMIVPTVLSDQ